MDKELGKNIKAMRLAKKMTLMSRKKQTSQSLSFDG